MNHLVKFVKLNSLVIKLLVSRMNILKKEQDRVGVQQSNCRYR